MDKDMKIDVKILNELKRYNSINNYIMEQDAELPPPPAGDVPPPDAGMAPPAPDAGMAPPAPDAGMAPPSPDAGMAPAGPVDVANDPDVEKLDDKKEESDKEELEITDLVKSQKNVEQKQEEYFEQLFDHLGNLENKLGEMDSIVNKLNDLEAKIEKYRTKSPEEKLELRSLDSGPFNQKLTDYFEDKEEDFEKLGRDEYILTKDEVEEFSPSDIKRSFRNFEEDETDLNNFKRLR